MNKKRYKLQLNIRGKLMEWDSPLIMGVLNITPDSEGSRVHSEQDFLEKIGEMCKAGADVIDVGGQSTRPGSRSIDAKEEADRVIPMLELALKHFPDILFSLDTYFAEVAQLGLKTGVHFLNDISAGDYADKMYEIVAAYKVPYIAMHKKGNPQTMQDNPHYEDVCKEVTSYLASKLASSREAGIPDTIVDFGFGFGKNTEHNYELLRNLNAIKNVLQAPILVGISRKRMIWQTLHITRELSLGATSALHLMALQQGADILRVHDVSEAIHVRTLWQDWL